MKHRSILICQILVICTAFYVVVSQITNFPFPSPFAKPFLDVREKWPTELVMKWIENGNPDASFVEFFNRDPERTVPPGNGIVSPADGVVKAIYTTDDIDYFTIGLSFWDVHVVRTPIAGTVTAIDEEGLSLFRTESETSNMAFLKGKAGPVQAIVTIAGDDGTTLKVRLITSYWASRLKVFVREGQRLEKGERIGRILLGSSVVVDFPSKFEFASKQFERVVGGETVIVEVP
jgi:phosphatidylserine decarboxylase